MFVFLFAILAATPQEELVKVQAMHQSLQNFSVKFEMDRFDSMRQKHRKESGQFWVHRNGKVRWTFFSPTRKDFFFSGEQAYFYEPENAQVTIFKRFRKSPAWKAMGFLWGQGQIDEQFFAQKCGNECGTASSREKWLKLQPRDSIAGVQKVFALIDVERKQLKIARVYDDLGNYTEYVFSAIVPLANIDASKFDFQMPDGVSVIRAD